MRCPACGATNPDSASWCGQCYASLAVPQPEPQQVVAGRASSTAPADDRTAADGQQPPAGDQQPSAGDEEAPAGGEAPAAVPDEGGPVRRGFRRRGETLEWQCVRCEEFNSIDVLACQTCGSPLSARYDSAEPEPERNWNLALALSVVLPGAGHISIGRVGSGVARAVLFAVFLTAALPVLAGQSSGAAIIAVAPMLLGVIALWGGSLADVLQLQRGEAEILSGRVLMWLTVGVLLLSLLGLATAVMMAQGGAG